MPYRLDYAQEARGDIMALGKDRSKVLDTIERRLRHEPTKVDTNRFKADPNPFGTWELRAQPYRVYYDVDEAAQSVEVRAVIYKPRETAYRRGRKVSTRD